MKSILIVSALLIITLSYTACKKKSNSTPATTTTIDSIQKVSQAVQVPSASPYPYSDVFIGPYNETDPTSEPAKQSGISTVTIQHISADSIVFYARSLGTPRSSANYSTVIKVTTHINALNTYSFSLQYYIDESDSYTCTLTNDSLSCSLDQPSGGIDDYTGTYTGYKQKQPR